jgi:hypothetical protein
MISRYPEQILSRRLQFAKRHKVTGPSARETDHLEGVLLTCV